MASLAECFVINDEYKILICTECCQSIYARHVGTHLRKRHVSSSSTIRDITLELQQSHPNLVQDWPDFRPPAILRTPIEGLPIYLDGMLCQADPDVCLYVCRNMESLKTHRRKQHPDLERAARGRSFKHKESHRIAMMASMSKRVDCQQFFVSSHHSAYIPIIPLHFESRNNDDQLNPSQSHLVPNSWDGLAKRLKTKDLEAQNRITPGPVCELSPWLQRTGWPEYLKNCLRWDLLNSIAMPSKDPVCDQVEEKRRQMERAIWDGMQSLAITCQKTLANSDHIVRSIAAQTEKMKTNHGPLESNQDPESFRQQVSPWQQMLMYLVRTQSPHTWKSPKYSFTQHQKKAFEDMVRTAEEVAHSGQSIIPSKRRSAFTNTRTDMSSVKLSVLESPILKFCITLLQQVAHAPHSCMPLVSASAVLGLGEGDQVWQTPDSYPPSLTKIIKLAQLMVVQYASDLVSSEGDAHEKGSGIPLQTESRCDTVSSGHDKDSEALVSSKRSKVSRPGLEDRADGEVVSVRSAEPLSLVATIEQFVQRFMQHGTLGPMGWFLGLRAYGLKIHYASTFSDHVDWRDHTILYRDIVVDMSSFKGMILSRTLETKVILLQKIMKINPDRNHEVPPIKWNQLYDDPDNCQAQWNFLRDSRNCFTVDGQNWLANRVQDTFQCQDGSWNISDSRTWLDRVAEFRASLLVLIHMTGGQPARAAEILSVRHSNSRHGEHRNLFIEDGLVVFVTKFHRGYRTNGDDTIIHRYLPRAVGELVVWYLWLVLPVVRVVECLVEAEQTSSVDLWPADYDGRVWTTSRLTDEIYGFSQEHLGLSNGMSVADYREIAIAISRKFLRGVPTEMTEYDDEDVGTEDRAPIQEAGYLSHCAGLAYAQESSEMSGVVARKRRLYRKVSFDWHQFIGFQPRPYDLDLSTAQEDAIRRLCHEGSIRHAR